MSFILFSAYISYIYKVYFTEVAGCFSFSFIALYSLNTLFTEIDLLLCPIYESIKSLEIRTSIGSYLAFLSNTIFSCLFFFFFIIDFCILIPAVLVHIFNPNVELLVSTGTAAN